MAEAQLCAVKRAYLEYEEFANSKLCGRCLPCLVAAPLVFDLLNRLQKGRANKRELEELRFLAQGVVLTARCKFGQEALEKLGKSLEEAALEFEAHCEGNCPQHACPELIRYRIDPERCTQCDLCRALCPTGAIIGDPYVPYSTDNHPYFILAAKCNGCGVCVSACPENAIELV
ncbi:4Fe-4S binding protein [Ammonifex thiophilus]|uniref:4Fe-4S binding protein n=1 Tax=Ammonifex thiophilus TaxID=444093 RepID=UPI00106D6A06|nr:4Fe-4S binding protein [Ammonifex thiophilus]